MNDFDNRLVNLSNAEVQRCILPEISVKKLTIDILRLDKIHPVISGNKWFKLQYYLQDALKISNIKVLTFGGAWSNHIIATAYLSKLYGLQSIGIIRGEEPTKYSKTLSAAKELGMTLEFISRERYTQKEDPDVLKFLANKFPDSFMIPEGGAGLSGIKGSKEILALVELPKYSHIVCCIGTGTMYSGLINASLQFQEITGITVLKGIAYKPAQFTEKVWKYPFCKISYDYHFGGYAKKTSDLIRFMNEFYIKTGVPTDFVYTGKLLFGCMDLVSKDYFSPGSSILIIHSGGLQGNQSLPSGTLLF